MSEIKKTYRVKPGRVFGKDDEYKPGDEVELTQEEASGFMDKLELVSGKIIRRSAKKETEKEKE